jgi:hypothetical protein
MNKRGVKLHLTYSLVKVDPQKERVVESPDDLINLKIKHSEVHWVRYLCAQLAFRRSTPM